MILPFALLDHGVKDPLALSVAPCFSTALINQTAVMKSGKRINQNTSPHLGPLFDHDIPIKTVACFSPCCTIMIWVLPLVPLSAPQALQWRRNLIQSLWRYPSKCQVHACSPNWNHPANMGPSVSVDKTQALRGRERTGSLRKQQSSDFWHVAPCDTEESHPVWEGTLLES